MYFELLARLMHVFWRFSRGQKIEVWVLAVDDGGRIFLAEREAGWRLPSAMLLPGQSALALVPHVLAAHGIEPGAAAPVLGGLHRIPERVGIDHVALYLVRDVSVVEHSTANTGRFFPADDLPDSMPAPARQLVADSLRA